MGNALEDTFNFVLDKGELWLGAFRRSDAMAVRIFEENATARERVRAVTALWFASFFLSLVVASPLYYGHGLKSEAAFHLVSILLQYVGLFLVAWCFHRALLMYGVRSNFVDTFVLQTIISAGLAPLFTLASLPAKLRMLTLVRAAPKVTEWWVFDVLKRVFASPVRQGTVIEIADLAALPLLMLIVAVGLARLLPMLRDHYGADSWRLVRALSFGVGVLAPIPAVLIAALEVVICCAFIQG
ncbi:MAG TPA: hypothetical protein VF698_08395 [Thermoanaerobaculia bacterium]